ncbi:hypothetical protein FQR65_LT10958 [Abscondita terminalis]|nr:hypothetical protein FQR65_LT10958 [Abscondita terminalis]
MADLCKLSTELQNIAEVELSEIPNRVKDDIAYIRKWLTEQHHLIARTDDHTLLIFLRNCKFSLEKTKAKIDLYYTIKSMFPKIFKNRDPFQPKIQYVLQNNIVSFLPKVSNGPFLLLVRGANANPDVVSMEDALKFAILLTEISLQHHVESSIVGHAILLDFKDASLKYFLQFTPAFLKKLATCFANVFLLRMKALYIINLPLTLVTGSNIFKSFLSPKLQNRVFFYLNNDLDGIQQHFPASVLPTEYGGDAGSFTDFCAQLKATVESYQEWILDDEQYLCIEEKRPSSNSYDVNFFSVEGSFRKLEID